MDDHRVVTVGLNDSFVLCLNGHRVAAMDGDASCPRCGNVVRMRKLSCSREHSVLKPYVLPKQPRTRATVA